jgi:hypothetical protein
MNTEIPKSTSGTTEVKTPQNTFIQNPKSIHNSPNSSNSTLTSPKLQPSETPNSVVIQHLSCTVPFMAGKHPINLKHCVQKIFTSSFYGPFTIYDPSGRILGKSKDSKISFFKEDLQTECARVWYDAFCLHPEYDALKCTYNVKDPGLCFGFGEVNIEFEEAPPIEKDMKYLHIPVFFNITNVWLPRQKETLFKC